MPHVLPLYKTSYVIVLRINLIIHPLHSLAGIGVFAQVNAVLATHRKPPLLPQESSMSSIKYGSFRTNLKIV